MFAVVGGNSSSSVHHSNIGLRLAVAWSRKRDLGHLVDGEPGYLGFGCIALRGKRCALNSSRLRRRSRTQRTNTVHVGITEWIWKGGNPRPLTLTVARRACSSTDHWQFSGKRMELIRRGQPPRRCSTSLARERPTILMAAAVLVSTNRSKRATPTARSMVNGLASAWLATALLALVEGRGYARRLRSEGATRPKGLFGV